MARRRPRATADRLRAGRARSGASVDGAELLQQKLRREVVAFPVHERDDSGEWGGGGARELHRNRIRGAHDHSATHADAGSPQREAELRRSRDRRTAGHIAAEVGTVDGQGGERWRLVDVVMRPPRGPNPPRVEVGLVGLDPARDLPDPVRPDLAGEDPKIPARERRIAEPLEDEVSIPGRPGKLSLAEDHRVDPEVRPEHVQRGVRDRQLGVRRRDERQLGVAEKTVRPEARSKATAPDWLARMCGTASAFASFVASAQAWWARGAAAATSAAVARTARTAGARRGTEAL